MLKRQTLKNEVTISGTGLHTGEESTIKIGPADAGTGIHFVRSNGDTSKIKADISKVISTKRRTSIGTEDNSIQTVEHLLSALYASSIDDATITIDGPEVPILDGSAIRFVDAIQEAGIDISEKDREYFEVQEVMTFKHEESGAEYIVIPAEQMEIHAHVQYEKPLKIRQSAYLSAIDQFQDDIAASRTYVFGQEIKSLLSDGLIKGGSIDNAIVIDDGSMNHEEQLDLASKFGITNLKGALDYDPNKGNELARHKILDLLGDLSLLGKPIKAKIIATQPGHSGNIAFTKFLKAKYLEQRKQKGKPIYDPTIEPLYDLEGIKALIPHRYPFLFVDKIIELTESKVVGLKNVTIDEHFFQGHFPDNPVFPGVLQLEALAQTGGILVLSTVEDPENYNCYFMKIDNVKFKHLVVPGDTMLLKMELLTPVRRGIVHMQGTVYVGNKIVSESELTALISKKTP